MFACAAARRTWEQFGDPRCRAALECVERYALGLANGRALTAARKEAEEALFAASVVQMNTQGAEWALRFGGLDEEEGSGRRRKDRQHKAAQRAARRAAANAVQAAQDAFADCEFVVACTAHEVGNHLFYRACTRFGTFHSPPPACDALRDILGNPFRPAAFDPNWATSEVRLLARAIITAQQFDDLPILADALEEAGCTNEIVLKHCREPGVHVGGCWVLAGTVRPV
jgi:hypothetical protein